MSAGADLGNEELRVTESDDGLVLRATIDRAEKRNALNDAILDGIDAFLADEEPAWRGQSGGDRGTRTGLDGGSGSEKAVVGDALTTRDECEHMPDAPAEIAEGVAPGREASAAVAYLRADRQRRAHLRHRGLTGATGGAVWSEPATPDEAREILDIG